MDSAEITWRSAVSFTRLAELLTEHYREHITRQRVYEWWKRETLNAAGQPFPREARADLDAPANRPNRHFHYGEVLAWTEAGVPTRYGQGWRHLGNGGV